MFLIPTNSTLSISNIGYSRCANYRDLFLHGHSCTWCG